MIIDRRRRKKKKKKSDLGSYPSHNDKQRQTLHCFLLGKVDEARQVTYTNELNASIDRSSS